MNELENRKDINQTKDPGRSEVFKMGESPVGKLLLEMAWPAIVSMLIGALYNIVDSIFVGMLSEEAFTAVSLANPIQLLLISLNVGTGVGVNSLISRRLGAQRYDEADQAAGTGFRIAFFNWALFLLFGLFLAHPVMSIYTDNPTLLRDAATYLRIVTVLSLFTSVDLEIEKILQSTGSMVWPMIISVSGAVTNIILDPIFIFGYFGVPRMEVAGAAIATVIGQFVSMTMGLIVFFRRKQAVSIQIKGFHVNWQVVKDIYAVGLPSVIMQSIGSFMLLGYNRILAENPTAVAVLVAYVQLPSFVFLPVFGLNQGAMPIMGYNFGARDRKRLMQTYRYGLAAAVIIMGAGLILFQTAPGALLRLFSANDSMLKIGIPALRRISLCFLPASFGIITSTLFQGTGHGVYSLWASMIRQMFCILPAAYILYHAYGVTASWFSFPLAEIFGVIYSVILLIHLYRKEIRNL
ncbi:MAG: MATE family efflux transporter [Eubacteriales bacterium]|nr:MATE family efflux transporter [Eubacteriales bacterium]